ncbi:MAG: hypothetical protein OJF48_003320 [Afipia sp.]|nr:MAG: hypothetical protein OJF48_003320 [Afipia sp.]
MSATDWFVSTVFSEIHPLPAMPGISAACASISCLVLDTI